MEVSKELILNALWETLYMVSISLFFGSIIGIFLGILLVVTRKGHIYENRFIFSIVNPIVNIFRSIPFIILLVAIIPFTRLMVGTSIGTTAKNCATRASYWPIYLKTCGEFAIGSG